MALTMRGPAAVLQVGYEPAATLGRWELEQTDAGFTLRAPVLQRNTYWLNAGYPVDLRVQVGRASWCWRNVTVSGDESEMTIMGVGRPEVG